jgi:hypothetical protein
MRVQRGDGVAALKQAAPASLDLVLLDPPFDSDFFTPALQAAAQAVAADGFVYLEAPRAWADEELAAWGLAVHRHLKAGAVHAHLLRRGGVAVVALVLIAAGACPSSASGCFLCIAVPYVAVHCIMRPSGRECPANAPFRQTGDNPPWPTTFSPCTPEPSTPSPWAMKTWCAEPPNCSARSSWPWPRATTRKPCSAWKSASRWCARLRANIRRCRSRAFQACCATLWWRVVARPWCAACAP